MKQFTRKSVLAALIAAAMLSSPAIDSGGSGGSSGGTSPGTGSSGSSGGTSGSAGTGSSGLVDPLMANLVLESFVKPRKHTASKDDK